MFCTNCGKQLEEGAVYCTHCGAPADSQQKATTPAPESAAQPCYDAAAAPQAGDIPPAVPARNKRMPKWLLIVLIAVAGILLLFGLLVVIELIEQAAVDAPEPVLEEPVSTPAEQPGTAPLKEIDTPELAAGECLYMGHGSCEGIEDIMLSFVLSADGSYIHNVTIAVTNLSGKADGLTVSASGMTERFMGEFPVKLDGIVNQNIQLGHSEILELIFFDGGADVGMDYVFYSSGAGVNAQSVEIPFGNIYIPLTAQGDTQAAAATIRPTETPAPTATPDPMRTEFDSKLLRNWDSAAMQEAYGIDSIYAFHPQYPENRLYIVCAEGGVIDPVTGRESEGGYLRDTARHMPIDTERMLKLCGNLKDGGLILTDDPQKATYALVLHFSYSNNIGTFRFSADNSTIKQYHATLTAELVNMVTGQIIASEQKNAFATYTGESVRTSMLEAAKGKQLYSDAPTLSADDFEDYWPFINSGDGV